VHPSLRKQTPDGSAQIKVNDVWRNCAFILNFLLFDLKLVSKVIPIEAKVVNGEIPTPKEVVMGNVKRSGPRNTEISSMQLSADTLPLVQGSRKGIDATCNTSVVSDPYLY
jgi:hypothetical protein